MLGLIKQVFIGLLSFRRSLGFNCMSLNNEPPWLGGLLLLSLIIIHIWLVKINIMEIVMVSITYLQIYVFPVKQKIPEQW